MRIASPTVCSTRSLAILVVGVLLLWIAPALQAQDAQSLKLTVAPSDQPRRYIVAEHLVPADRLKPPFQMRDAAGAGVHCQWEAAQNGNLVRWVIPTLDAGKGASFILQHANAAARPAMALLPDPKGFLSVRSPSREITRYYFGAWAKQFNKPFFYPIVVDGVAVTRGFPMEKKEGEANDHKHHTSVYFAHGEVNKKDYWATLPITPKQILAQVAGPVYARIVAENGWGSDVTETQDVLIIDAGQNIIMDWAITLAAAGDSPVHLGKTKEGGFAVRVATGLTDKGGGKMVDSEGNKGEPAIRAHQAPWADNYGTIDGKTVGVAIMNHPKSWRFPTAWHVRGYGLFAANAFYVQGEHNLKPGEPITLRYRLYVHAGDPEQAKVAEVYAGYAKADVKAE